MLHKLGMQRAPFSTCPVDTGLHTLPTASSLVLSALRGFTQNTTADFLEARDASASSQGIPSRKLPGKQHRMPPFRSPYRAGFRLTRGLATETDSAVRLPAYLTRRVRAGPAASEQRGEAEAGMPLAQKSQHCCLSNTNLPGATLLQGLDGDTSRTLWISAVNTDHGFLEACGWQSRSTFASAWKFLAQTQFQQNLLLGQRQTSQQGNVRSVL